LQAAACTGERLKDGSRRLRVFELRVRHAHASQDLGGTHAAEELGNPRRG